MSNSGQPSIQNWELGEPSQKPNGLGKAFSKLDLEGHNLPPSPAPSSPRNGRKYALATELVYTEGTDQYNASSTPIYQVRTSNDPFVLVRCKWTRQCLSGLLTP